MADFNPSASGGDDEMIVEAFRATPQPNGGTAGGAFPIPSSSVTESAKDKAIAVATASPPGPGQSTLVRVPRYSGPVPARPDASGQFPLPRWWCKGPRSSWLTPLYFAPLWNMLFPMRPRR